MFVELNGFMKPVNQYIIDFLIKNTMINKKESDLYKSNITDTVFKFYYSWIANNGSYFGLEPKISPFKPTREGLKIVNSISQRSQISTVKVSYILTALCKLVENGTFPNNWMYPDKASAKRLYEFLDSNPTFIVNFLDNALKQLKPILSSSINTIPNEIKNFDFTKITTPLIIAGAIVAVIFLKPYIKDIKKNG